MTTETQETQVAAFEIGAAGSVERALGRLEGQNQVLLQVVQEQGRQARQDYRDLDAKITAVQAEVGRLLYWVLGVAGVIIATIVGAAFTVILLG